MDRFKYNKKPKILFCTGAGASKESGLNTFRDPQTGYWRQYNPMEIASIKALENDPIEVNKFYNERRMALANVIPNYFHEFVALTQKKYGSDRVAVMTTNVDDLHERTGLDQVYKIHGSLKEIVTFEGEVKNIGYQPLIGEDLTSCRPNVVMFGESSYVKNGKLFNPYPEIEKTINLLNSHDVMFIVGCSSAVVNFPAIAMFNLNNPKVYIVNPNDGDSLIVSGREKVIKHSACDAVQYIEDIILEIMN